MDTFEALSSKILAVLTEDGSWNPRKWKKCQHLRKELNDLEVPGFYTLPEKVLAVRHGLKTRPVCEVCGGKVSAGQDAFRKTCSIKCGAANSKTKDKIKTTLLSKYGAHHTQNKMWSDNQVRQNKLNGSYAKGVKTLQEKIGVASVFGLPEVQTKIKQTNLKRYGTDNPSKNSTVMLKRQSTCLTKFNKSHSFPLLYGDNNPMRNHACVFSARCKKLAIKDWSAIEQTFQKKFTFISICGDEHTAVCDNCGEAFKSVRIKSRCSCTETSMEREIYDFLHELGVKTKRNDRTLLNGLELDFLCEEFNFAIELNGVYWHGETALSKRANAKTYHYEKFKLCSEKGIALLQITDLDWRQNNNLVKSMIKSRLNLNKRIYARKCEVKLISSAAARTFADNNHISGYAAGKWNYGLYYNDDLVMLCIFGKNRFTTGVELIRMCSLQGLTITGGFSKLLSSFVRDTNTGEVVSYCDLRYGAGSSYIKTGFNLVSQTSPGYWYINPSKTKISSRIAFQKHKLSQKLEVFDSTLTEWENMQNNSYDRIWDCGHRKFTYHTTNT